MQAMLRLLSLSTMMAVVSSTPLTRLHALSSRGESATAPLERRGAAVDYNQNYIASGAGVTYTPDEAAGSFTVSYDTSADFVVGLGWTVGDSDGSFSASGVGLLSVYGWSEDPLVEYYIMETDTGYSKTGTQKGTLTSDGATYEIWEHQQVNQPSIKGTTTFNQYISIRQTPRTSGTVTIKNHFDAWAAVGMNLGSMNYQVMAIESWTGSGSGKITLSKGTASASASTSSSGETTSTPDTSNNSTTATTDTSTSPATTGGGSSGDCPAIHIFGARETTASPGYGTAGVVVDLITGAYPDSTSEAISYPACGGQSSCGGDSYGQSVAAGVSAVVDAVNSFASKCPDTQIVLVGYSQGAEIFDTSLCGGGDPNQGLSSTGSIASANIAAAIFMGDPRFQTGAPYNVGTCSAGGFDARPAGQVCGTYNSKIQSYCDAADPYCCNGDNDATHSGYGTEYGQDALKFVQSKLKDTSSSVSSTPSSSVSSGSPASSVSAASSGSATSSGLTVSSSSASSVNVAAKWGQCGGSGFSSSTACPSGSTCVAVNTYYSQCQ